MTIRPLHALGAFAAAVIALILWVQVTCACSTVRGAYYMTARSHLRDLVELQAKRYAEHKGFARTLDELLADGFSVSDGVTVELEAVGDSAWFATSRHRELADVTCRVEGWIAAGPPAPSARASEVECVPPMR